MAWGFVGEEHCRYSAYRDPDGQWSAPTTGCPVVRVLPERDGVTRIALDTGNGGELVLPPATRSPENMPSPKNMPPPPESMPPPAAYATDSGFGRPVACQFAQANQVS